MRNLQKDAVEMAARRKTMLNTGFRIFAETNIETVTMQEIADASELGVATVYRYFKTKAALASSIAAKVWQDYYAEVEKLYNARNVEAMTAADELVFYLDCFIDLYRNHKDFLRFNHNFSAFVRHEKVTKETLKPYTDAMEEFVKKYHSLYQKAKKDGTLKVNLPEKKFFASTLHMMFCISERFAAGLLPDASFAYEEDLTDELVLLKDMILLACKT